VRTNLACFFPEPCQSKPTESKLIDVELQIVQNAAQQMDLNVVLSASALCLPDRAFPVFPRSALF